jgi:hypothetical protein
MSTILYKMECCADEDSIWLLKEILAVAATKMGGRGEDVGGWDLGGEKMQELVGGALVCA